MWLFPMHGSLKPISLKEDECASRLPLRKSIQFRESRGNLRYALSSLWNIDPLDIPLIALPGQPPLLAESWGHISFSHCQDALLIGWSQFPLGVDIERFDRSISAGKLARRYFYKTDQKSILSLEGEQMRALVLDQWLFKESAIKWQKSSISKDLKYWRWDKKESKLVHVLLGYNLKAYKLSYSDWLIAVAIDVNAPVRMPILCLAN